MKTRIKNDTGMLVRGLVFFGAAVFIGVIASGAASQGFSGMRGRGGMMGGGGMMGSGPNPRQAYVMRNGIPAAYRGLRSPAQTSADVAAGGRLYQADCASCHGARGAGDGEAGRDLSPPPAPLDLTVQTPMGRSDYLLWTISEGGSRFGSAMPPFKDVLSRPQIWQVIAYMRAGFPPVAPAPGGDGGK